jgi:hypothetical protein
VTVKSGLSSMCGPSLPLHQSANSFSFYGLWKGVDPFKARVFCWLAILNRINTKGVLARRDLTREESAEHLLRGIGRFGQYS